MKISFVYRFSSSNSDDSNEALRAKFCIQPMPFPDLTEITKDTEMGAVKALKNLCALCASVRNSVYNPCRFQISRRSQRTRRWEQSKLQKTSVHSVPPSETLYTTHAVFRSHGDHKGHGERSSQSFKKPLCTLCLRAKLRTQNSFIVPRSLRE